MSPKLVGTGKLIVPPPVRDPNVAVAHLCGLRLAGNVRSVTGFAVRWHIGHAVPYEAARPCMAAETHEDPTVTARLTSSRGACNKDEDKSPALLQTRKAAIVRQCRATRLCQTFIVRSKASHTHRHHPVQLLTVGALATSLKNAVRHVHATCAFQNHQPVVYR